MDNKLIGIENNILFYCDEEGNTKVEVLVENEEEEYEERLTILSIINMSEDELSILKK